MRSTLIDSPAVTSAETLPVAELLRQVQQYMTHPKGGPSPSQELKAAWDVFYARCSEKTRKYLFSRGCGSWMTAEDIADCVQDVWAELLVELPPFQYDPNRGHVDSWVIRIVRSKLGNIHRSRKRRPSQENLDTLQSVIDQHPSVAQTLEEKEFLALVWDQARERLSARDFQILQMRVQEDRPVPKVAEAVGLNCDQVSRRYYLILRELKQIGSDLGLG